ncbi:DUF3576 domain-containing protein [Fuscibacter oryzae]|uniref:DUF3576 domain-containing protein n=1 Tax=Fuscibacter oryzae TaxID=2803939 RepID=A0A8J7SUJ2_9RHOB|nr:DUF3576 domain-containing protein [Fuscibacter oryzae]MBL4929645.1 DUF3576 domain-containing protein [Fuscibacter oryzae]
MSIGRFTRGLISGALILALAACSGGGKGWFGDKAAKTREDREMAGTGMGTSLRGLLNGGANPNTTVEVNKYIWNASLDVLSFLPIESVDPFTGVIVTGYGAPPGGGRAYRATIYVQDPALDARSLRIAMQTKGGGAVAPETVRAVEDAILTRARQLRVQDGKL